MIRKPRFAVLLTGIILASGCGGCREPLGHDAPPAAEPPPPADAIATSDGPETTRLGGEPSADEAPRFAPGGRHAWPDDFRLPLHIDIEIPEIPQGIRGPSPPIEEASS